MNRLLVALLLASAQPLAAQAPQKSEGATNPVMGSTRPHYERVKDYLLRAAEQMPEEHYAFRPTPEVRTFGEMIGHLADTQYYFCSTALGEENPQKEELEKTRTTKTALVEAIRASFEYCDRSYEMTDARVTRSVQLSGREQLPLSMLILNVGHGNEHYGNIVTYMRMKGLVPPSSQPRS